MNFENALDAIKTFNKVKRKGWNGKDQYLFFVPNHKIDTIGNTIGIEEKEWDMSPCICLKNQQGMFAFWIPSTGDLFADDWELVL